METVHHKYLRLSRFEFALLFHMENSDYETSVSSAREETNRILLCWTKTGQSRELYFRQEFDSCEHLCVFKLLYISQIGYTLLLNHIKISISLAIGSLFCFLTIAGKFNISPDDALVWIVKFICRTDYDHFIKNQEKVRHLKVKRIGRLRRGRGGSCC